MADAPDLGSGSERIGGSSPLARTTFSGHFKKKLSGTDKDRGGYGYDAARSDIIYPILGHTLYRKRTLCNVLADGFSITFCEYDEKIDVGMVPAVILDIIV
jgi:hypothetical protein